MEKISFKLWLEGHKATVGKISLYPSLYTGYANFPPSSVITWSADSLTYMNDKDIQFKAYSGKFRPYFWSGIYQGKPTSD